MKNSSHDTPLPHEPNPAGTAQDAESHGTVPGATPATPPTPATTRTSSSQAASDPYPSSTGGKVGSVWVTLALGALVTILLLVFIVQNNNSSEVQFFGWQFSLPLGVLVLLAAIAGALIMALFAGVRILQLRMSAHKARKLAQH